MTVADHQAATVLVDLVSMAGDVGGDLGLQRRGQHPPGPIADAHIEQRAPAEPVLSGCSSSWTAVSIGVPSRTSAPTPVLIRPLGFQIILGEVRPFTSPRRGPSTSSDHLLDTEPACALEDFGVVDGTDGDVLIDRLASNQLPAGLFVHKAHKG